LTAVVPVPARVATGPAERGVKEALDDTAKFYRKALWRNPDSYVEVWLEKDALSDVVYPVTHAFEVP
jgi:hypothetical protein